MNRCITSIVTIIEFCAGHRVPGHAGNCKHFHGHNYKVGVTLEGAVKADGMIVDFGIIKKKMKDWIDANLDHGMIVWVNDDLLPKVADSFTRKWIMDQPPTAENIASLLMQVARAAVNNEPGLECRVASVRVWETPTAFAEVVNEGI